MHAHLFAVAPNSRLARATSTALRLLAAALALAAAACELPGDDDPGRFVGRSAVEAAAPGGFTGGLDLPPAELEAVTPLIVPDGVLVIENRDCYVEARPREIVGDERLYRVDVDASFCVIDVARDLRRVFTPTTGTAVRTPDALTFHLDATAAINGEAVDLRFSFVGEPERPANAHTFPVPGVDG